MRSSAWLVVGHFTTVVTTVVASVTAACSGEVVDHRPATSPDFIYGPSGAEWIAYRHETPPGRSIHIADVDLCAPGIEVRTTGPWDGRQTVSQYAAATGALVAVNGGHSWDGAPGPSAHAGEFFGLPDAGDLGQIAFGDGVAELVHMSQGYAPMPWHREVMTGLLTLVHDGAIESFGPGYTCDVQHPRTLIGLTADRRRLILAVIDGRARGRTGMTCAESAAYMASLGAHWALNLDGGGSTEMVLGGTIVNRPSDGGERVVPTHLAIVRTPGARGHCPTEPPPPPAPAACGTLVPGQALAPGQSVRACGGQVVLAHQGDGNVVLYAADGRALWHTFTSGQATTELVVQGDGNLVLHGPGGPIWSSETSGFPGAYLGVQDDGNAVLYAGGYAIWATHTSATRPEEPAPVPTFTPEVLPPPGCGTLAAGQGLAPDQAVTSCDGRFVLAHQADGNVVLYQEGWPLWSTGTDGLATTVLAIQDDGNLVLDGPWGVIWASGTWGAAGASLALQDDGNAVIYAGGNAVWSTDTCCR